MANIYQISQELLSIFDIIEENGGELTPELEEALTLTQESFNNKIKDYTNVVKMIQADIMDIKVEKARLNELQKSKEKTIDKLKSIIIKAINDFGTANKSGVKSIDYGTGKVSIRKSTTVEVDEDNINSFVKRYVNGLNWYNMQNQLDRSIIDDKTLLQYANQTDDDEELVDLNYTKEDIAKLNADIDVNVSLDEIISSDKGFELAKALIKFGRFDIKASVDKNNIKSTANETKFVPAFARVVTNENLTIK